MGLRLAVVVTLLSLLCLFSAPLYDATSWRGGVPASIREQTEAVPLGQAVMHTLDGAQEYHAVRLPPNQSLRIDLSSTRFDPYLTLYRVAGDSLELIKTDDDGGDGTNARIERCIVDAGTYVLKVTAVGSSRDGPYEIRATASAADCAAIAAAELERERAAQRQREEEESRRREEARTRYRQGRTISFEQTVSGSLGISSARTSDGKPFDSWELACEAGQALQLDIDGQGYDAYARVVNPEGAEVATDDDSGGSMDPRILYTCPTSGTYFLVSTIYGNSGGGSYSLRVSRR